MAAGGVEPRPYEMLTVPVASTVRRGVVTPPYKVVVP